MNNKNWKKALGILAASMVAYLVIKAVVSAGELYFTTILFFVFLPTIIGHIFMTIDLINMKKWAWITFILITIIAIFSGCAEIISFSIKWSLDIFCYSFLDVSLVVMPILGISFVLRKLVWKNSSEKQNR